MVPIATGLQPTSAFYFMEMVSIISMILLIGICISMVRKRIVLYKQTKSAPGMILLWIGFAFVAFSLLLNTGGAGSFISLFVSEVLHLGYILPLTLAVDVFMLSVGIMLSAGIFALLTHEARPKEPKRSRGRRPATDQKATTKKPEEAAQHMGTEVFGQNH